MIGRGQPYAAIGSALFFAETTVRTHIAHILTKLGLADRTQAVVVADETGLVRLGEATARRSSTSQIEILLGQHHCGPG